MAMETPFLFDKSDLPANRPSAHTPEPRRTRTAAKKTISDLLFQEAILAVKESADLPGSQGAADAFDRQFPAE